MRLKIRGFKLRRNKIAAKLHRIFIKTFLLKKGLLLNSPDGGAGNWFYPLKQRPSNFTKLFADEVDLTVHAIINLLSADDVFVDVGAYDGMFTLFAARKLVRGEVYAFEPDPHNYKTLLANIETNKCPNITAENKAVSNVTGRALIHMDMQSHKTSSLSQQNVQSSETNRVEIETVSLDDYFLEQRHGHKLSFIKIDAEGYDGHVINGMARVIRSFKPKILIEFYPYGLAVAGTDPIGLLNTLESYGYKPAIVIPTHGDVIDMTWDKLRSGVKNCRPLKVVWQLDPYKAFPHFANLLLLQGASNS